MRTRIGLNMSHFKTRGRILLIDDNQDAIELLQMLLLSHGFDVETATSGARGLELAAAFMPDVIMCDLGMPGMNGFDVAKALRATARLSDVYLLAVTGWSDADTRRRVIEAGFDRHLAKPVGFDALQEALHDYFEATC
jgi:CheY-like chemotaxis protein